MKSFDENEYRALLDPHNIFELLDKEVFLELIRGFHHKFRRGAVLLWAERDAITSKWVVDVNNRLEPPEHSGPEKPEDFNDFCWKVQHLPNMGGLKRCRQCDCDIAQEYVDGVRKEPDTYPCWLGLTEFAFPLRVGGEVRAVLLAGGQMVPIDISSIEKNVRELTGDESLRNKLLASLPPEPARSSNDLVMERLNEVNRIGKALQKIIDRLHAARVDTATRVLLKNALETLAKADMCARDRWWKDVSELLPQFCQMIGVEEMIVYSRRYARFERLDAAQEAPKNLIPVRDVLSAISKDTLKPLDHADANTRMLMERLQTRDGQVHAYVTEHRGEKLVLSTLMVIRGNITEKNRTRVEAFCQLLGNRTDVASMVFLLQETQTNYKLRVGAVAHSFRMPLQTVLFDLHDLAEQSAAWSDVELPGRIRESIDRVTDAKADIQILLEEAGETYEIADLSEMLTRVLNDMQRMAEQKGCHIVRKNLWPDGLQMRANKYRLRRAFWNLFDNAIKYSWDGHQIRLWVDLWSNDMVKIRISNYGLGIPADRLSTIREIGGRGEVHDSKRPKRVGSGWGLPVAISAVLDRGGWLEIDSYPADEAPRAAGEEYHRYVTEVAVYLPLIGSD